MLRRFRFLLTPAMLLLVLCSYPALAPALAQENSFQGYGPMPGIKMNPTLNNPFIGAWMARLPMQDGNGKLVAFIEYLPNGTFRSETTVEGGLMNRARIQMWGRYQIERIDHTHFALRASALGIAPKEFCVHEGDCKPNTLPDAVIETDEIVDVDSFHSKFTAQGVETEADVHRSYLPLDFGQPLADSIQLPVPQAGAPMPDPQRYYVPTGDDRCDNLQQQRICVINGGRMVSVGRGCQKCVDLDAPDPKPEATTKTEPPTDANTGQSPVTPHP